MGKRIYLIFIIFILMITSSCSKTNYASVNDKGLIKPEGSINIYLQMEGIEVKAARILEKIYKDVKVNITYINDLEQFSKQLNTEIMTGLGPDVILFKYYSLGSLYKLIYNGAFLDVDPMIGKDKSFRIEDYFEQVMECGVYKGKRYVLPIDFSINAFATTDEIMNRNKMEIDTKRWKWQEYMKVIEEFSKASHGKGEYFSNDYRPFSDFVIASGVRFIDYEKKKTYFDSSQFIQLLNDYKKICQLVAPNEINQKYGGFSGEMMKDNVIQATGNRKIVNPYVLWMCQSDIYNYTKGSVRLFTYPMLSKSGSYAAAPYDMAAINKNSKNSQLAYAYIKVLLSEDIQKGRELLGAPVNKLGFNKLLDELTGEKGNVNQDKTTWVSIPQTLATDLKHIVSNIAQCEINDNSVLSFMDQVADVFISGKCSAEQAVKSMESKVSLYLNE